MVSSPIGPCVKVQWDIGIEFVPVHPDYELPFKFETAEYWSESKRWVRYNPTYDRNDSYKSIKYVITYAPAQHPDFTEEDDIRWGVSTIIIDKASRKVVASWKGTDNTYDGLARLASLVEQKDRARTKARPTMRNQSNLRNFLLDTDGACGITGESTRSALECAHIVSVENEGYEMDRNAILLRADLHCLYDNGRFEIAPTGKIEKVSAGLSEYYRDLLKGKKLNELLTRRVAASLAKKRKS